MKHAKTLMLFIGLITLIMAGCAPATPPGIGGNVTINGFLQLEQTDVPGTCDVNTAGTIYYDNTLNEVCDCNGSSWAQIDGEGLC